MKDILVKKRISLSVPHMSGKEMNYIQEAFESNWIAPLGSNVEAFEKEIANYVGAEGAVAVSSGTAAIHLALILLEVKRGDTVFCSTLTFVASANPILYQEAEPVFIDSEPETWNMSPEALEKAFEDAVKHNKMPKAVIVVNLFGQSAKMDELTSICAKYDVPIIEDAAESLGATYKGKASGTFGEFGVYSFNGNKIITTSGGGVLVSDNVEALMKARFLATQAKDPAPYYQHSERGYNYRLSNISAGIGRAQLQVLDNRVEARRAVYKIYEQELSNYSAITFMPELENTMTNRWLTALTINENMTNMTTSELLSYLEEENIEGRHVWKPMHMQPLFRKCKYFAHTYNGKISISEKLFNGGICLPSSSNMTIEEQLRVVQCIKYMFGK